MLSAKINFLFIAVIATALLFLFVPAVANSQMMGCTDPSANNYNPSATINDGSCTYNITTYTAPIKIDPISDSLAESSGLQMAGNSLWSFNDRGGTATLYRIDTVANILLQRIILLGAQNTDWEDIAFDGTYFYIGDFGNNASGDRTDLRIYKFPFAAIPDYVTNPVAVIDASNIETIYFTYSDQPQPPATTALNSTQFDCEAMIVDAGKIHLFTKNWIDNISTHYVINSTAGGTYKALAIETLNTGYLVTGADKAPGLKMVALLGYQSSGTGKHFLHLLTGYSNGKYFNGNKRKIDLPDVTVMGQAEGITFRNSSDGYISNEKFMFGSFFTVQQKLRTFNISSFVNAVPGSYIFTGDGNWSLAANWANGIVPPASPLQGSEIIIDPVMNGACVLDIPYTVSSGTNITVSDGIFFLVQGNLIIR